MIKKITLIVVFLLSLSYAKAQEFEAGALFGLCVSQVDGDNMSGYHRFGPQGGLFVEYKFNNTHAFQMELLYCMRGSATPSQKEPVYMGEIKSQYVDLALYYKYWFDKKLNLKVGLTPSYMINYSYTCNGVRQDNVAEFRKIGLGFSAGVEYYLNEHFFAVADFNYSLISIREGKAEFSDMGAYYFRFIFDNGQFYNYLKFSLGYKF